MKAIHPNHQLRKLKAKSSGIVLSTQFNPARTQPNTTQIIINNSTNQKGYTIQEEHHRKSTIAGSTGKTAPELENNVTAAQLITHQICRKCKTHHLPRTTRNDLNPRSRLFYALSQNHARSCRIRLS